MDIEKEIVEIKNRNQRVEIDKQWESSWMRRLVVATMTYMIAAVWLGIISESNLWWKAFVPTVGYFLSTLTLPPIKNWWMQKHKIN